MELDAVDRVLELLSDVPAGKLAIAALATPTSEDLAVLERAGVDAVLIDVEHAATLLVRDDGWQSSSAPSRRSVAGCGGDDATSTSATGAPAALVPEGLEGGLAAARERRRSDGVLPDLDAVAGRREDRRRVQERPLGGQEGPLLPRQLPLARSGRRRQSRGAREFPRLSRPDDDSLVRDDSHRQGQDCAWNRPLLRRPRPKKRLGTITATATRSTRASTSGTCSISGVTTAPCTRSASTSSRRTRTRGRQEPRTDDPRVRPARADGLSLAADATGAARQRGCRGAGCGRCLRARRQAGGVALAACRRTLPPEQHLLDGIGSSSTTTSRSSCRPCTTRSSRRSSRSRASANDLRRGLRSWRTRSGSSSRDTTERRPASA